MKKLIIIALVLLAIPAMAMADYRADRADLLASAGLFNVAALDNPVYMEQAKGMDADTSRGRVSIRGSKVTPFGSVVHNSDYEGSVNHFELKNWRFSGTASDTEEKPGISDYVTLQNTTYYYNNGAITSMSMHSEMKKIEAGNRVTSYGTESYSSRRP